MRGSGIAPSPSPSHTLCTPFPASTSNSQAVYKRLYDLAPTTQTTVLASFPGLVQVVCKVMTVGRWPGNEANRIIVESHLFLQALRKKIGLSDQMGKFFGLFQRMEHDFGKLVSFLSPTQATNCGGCKFKHTSEVKDKLSPSPRS